MRKIAVSVATALCALAAAPTAHADDVTFPGFAHGSQTVTYQLLSPNTTVSGSASAGGFSTSLNGGPTFTSYCVDLYQTIGFGTAYHDYMPVGAHVFANSDAYADLSRLFAYAGPIVDAVHEAAFQMAVWEIAYETGELYSLGAGSARFSGTAEATSLAAGWLAGLAARPLGPMIGVLESSGQQDVIYAPVPEPTEIALMLSGLVAIAGVARRRKKVAAAA